jgi:hypothetical protein
VSLQPNGAVTSAWRLTQLPVSVSDLD